MMLLGIQSAFTQQRLHLIGNIEDAKDNSPIAFCNIALTDAKDETKVLAGTATDERGRFSLRLTSDKECVFRASFIGYEQIAITIRPQDFKNRGGDTIFLYNLKMFPTSENLEAVEVVAEVKRYEMDADRLVMNVDDATRTSVVTAFDLLRKVPGVSIDKDENLTLNGRGGVLFQFNGRDMRLGWDAIKSMLKGMNPQQVEKFEIVTNPSAKYDAEGTAGIINIKMLKNQTYGLNGSVNAGVRYNTDPSFMGGLNLNYVDDKWTTSLNYSLSNWKQTSSTSSNRLNFLGGDTIRVYSPMSDYTWKMTGHNLSFSTDYMVSEKNSIGLYANYSNNFQPRLEQDNQALISHSPALDVPYQRMDNLSGSSFTSNDLLVGVNYLHQFDTLGTKLQFDASLTVDASSSESDSRTDYLSLLDNSAISHAQIANSTDNSHKSFAAKVDFQKPTSRWGTFEAGAKATITRADNDFVQSEERHLPTDESRTNARNNFLFDEDIYAAYLSYSKTFSKKTSLRAGVRFEYTKTRGEQVSMDSVNDNSYYDFFPNISLNHNFNDFNSLSLSYNYRISRPYYDQLNPFLSKSSDYSYECGNPLLRPQYSHNIGLNYSLFYMAFLSVNYGYGSDFVSEVIHPYGENGAMITSPGNVATSQNLNIGLSVVAPVAKWLDFNFYGQINYTNVVSKEANSEMEINNTAYMCFGSANFNLPWKLRLSLSGYYMSGGVWAVYRYSGSHSFDVSISRTFLKDDKLRVSLGAGNLFAKREMTNSSTQNGVYFENNMRFPGTTFSFNIRYNFGKVYQSKHLQKINSDEMNERATGGSGSGGTNRQKD